MATEGDPADVVKVLHLLFMAFSWGMQVWVAFISGFVLLSKVTVHTFGLVQSKIFPTYFYCLLGSNTVSLAIYAVYHPRELLNWHETLQMALFLVAVIMAGLNVQWFTPAVTEHLEVVREIEQEHGLGGEIGFFTNRERYIKLREQDPKYKAHKTSFRHYHGLSTLSHHIGFACTTVNLIYLALHLASI
ncbi:transmembrane protein 205 [Neoarius graeffei]|uniref:transmembrane protein 205 n=1 Tax=Neoarius graeffei TaxID=443677 RepID=UPI00298C9FE6|nr:transmembrane protein 205 [Neoarius graeffei]